MVMTQEKETNDFVCYEFKILELINLSFSLLE